MDRDVDTAGRTREPSVAERVFRVHGRVQGVGYRWWTRGEAARLGITGTVRNCRDGTVEVRARAPADLLDRFRSLLEQGPPTAHVERVEETEGKDLPTDGFEIVR